MPYTRTAALIFLLLLSWRCFSQDALERKNRLTDHVTEVFHVLASDENIRDGLYQAFYKRKTPIATGLYIKGEKIGIWRFYNPRGRLLETYDYDKKLIEYEAPETRPSNFSYVVDKDLTDSDKTTKPYKPGGRYFGYLPYLNAFKTPFLDYDSGLYMGLVELLISPMGRLADFKVHVYGPNLEQNVNLSIKLMSEEDKQFIPATINGEPVICRILIKCRLTDDGGLDFF